MSDLSDLDRVDDAARVIADYVAESYECMAQIEMAKRRFAELKRQVVSTLAPIEQDLSVAERLRLFADFYWDATDLPSEPVMLGLGYQSVNQLARNLARGTGIPCLLCGGELTAKSRSHLQAIQDCFRNPPPRPSNLYCTACKKIEQKASELEWQRRQETLRARQKRLRSIPYAEYLHSPEWQQTRSFALKRAQYRCQLCSATNMILDVHHNTYQRLGVEQPGDLIVLCRPCHTKHHTELPELGMVP